MTKTLLIISTILFVALFYSGVHLNEEEQAFLEGLRPTSSDSYAWATTAYAVFLVVCTVVASWLMYQIDQCRTWLTKVFTVVSVVVGLYGVGQLLMSVDGTMQSFLSVIGVYVVLGIWLQFYFLLADSRTKLL